MERFDVDMCLRELEEEDEREREALRKFLERERPGFSLRGWSKRHPIAWFCLSTVLAFLLTVAFVIAWLAL